MVLLDRGNKRAIVGFMTRAAYYRHIRSLGSFPGKREVSYEVLPDGSGMLRASRSITVY